MNIRYNFKTFTSLNSCIIIFKILNSFNITQLSYTTESKLACTFDLDCAVFKEKFLYII